MCSPPIPMPTMSEVKYEKGVLKMVKVPSLALALSMAVAVFSPAAAQTDGQQVTITFWDIQPADLVPLRSEIIAAFEAEHPTIKVEYLNIPFAEARQKMIVAAATDTLPDIMFFSAPWLGEFAAMGKLLDLGPYVENWPGAANLLPQVFDVGRAYEDTLYYLPSEFQIDALYYRKDWLEEAGLKPPPWDWDEFLDVARAMTDPANNRYGFSLRGGNGNERYYIMWMLMANGNVFFEEDGSLGLHKHGGADGLKFYIELCTVHKVCTPNSVNNSFLENTAEFSSGVAGMYIHNQYSVARQVGAFGETIEAAQETFDTAPIPRGPKGRFIAANFTNGYVIFNTSPNPDAAWELLEWYLSPENDSKAAQRSGALPANRTVYEEEWFTSNPFLKVFKEQLDEPGGSFSFPIQMPEWNGLAAGPLKEEFQKALLGQQSPEETTEAIVEAINGALQ